NMRTRYTNEVQNVALAPAPPGDPGALLRYETTGPWWELLAGLDVSLAVSAAQEPRLLHLANDAIRPRQSPLALPHPSGLFYDEGRDELIVSSTRTPNQIFFFKRVGDVDYGREVVPADFTRPEGALYVPYRSVLLPGTLYIHDLVLMGDEIFVTATGHNFLARILPLGGWERVWWPACVDGLGRASFDQNYLQLNSIACAGRPERSYYTAFSDQTFGPKPWKEGYGPRGKGVVFAGSSRQPICRGLTCPHSAKLREGKLWLCNSGYGEVGILDVVDEGSDAGNRYAALVSVPGFTRGLAFAGKYGFVGLSKVIDFYEPYAPGLDPKA